MKTFRFIGMALMAVFMSVNFAACDDDDEDLLPSPPKWECVFLIDGKEVCDGGTVHVSDSVNSCTIEWKDVNDPTALHKLYACGDNWAFNFIELLGNNIKMECSGFRVCGRKYEILFIDDLTHQTFTFSVVFDEMDIDTLKEKIKVSGIVEPSIIVDGISKTGPFVELYAEEGLGVSGRINVLSFGWDTYSYEASIWTVFRDWHKVNFMNGDSRDEYTGRLDSNDFSSGNGFQREFHFFVFSYANKQYEVRYYRNLRKCLWNGEWENL